MSKIQDEFIRDMTTMRAQSGHVSKGEMRSRLNEVLDEKYFRMNLSFVVGGLMGMLIMYCLIKLY